MKLKIMAVISAFILIVMLNSCTNTNTDADIHIDVTESIEVTTPTDSTSLAEITVSDSIDGQIKITPIPDLNASTLDKNSFIKTDSHRITYDDGNVYSVTGIDVSSHNGSIDWDKVKNNGVQFAIIRMGGRGYGESGSIYDDDFATHNIEKAKAAGLDVGVYFFSQAITVKEAEDEAQYIIDRLGDETLDLPIAYDFEFIEGDTARTDNITGKQMTDFANAFSSVIEEAGYKTMVYGESHDFYRMYDLSRLKIIPLWYAQYSNAPDFYYDYAIWQYTNEGTVDGISGNVDLNLMFMKK